ncbi:hypothetical protein PTUN_a2037 [Pseudoalteromonas tunicata]|nr:hypothetical protein PTUN_a2037 [Pseudoalteromonas tunicata]
MATINTAGAIGAFNSFSLKNALASGLTSGATAGVGNVLGVGCTVVQL